ncbi:NifU family protein [Clostridium ganghwense]|uniref:NifU family protein n=1 Tax=Clostridium ganghwense TaxID=312089 RepID=A0ABT4CS75_9CLOT|nr:NifU family protein [Clostridium ganghwense]MCY6371920.1 NifU family protein [Clostridium ganghwense]
MFEKVEKVLEAKVRPVLAKHYGNIELIKVEDGIVKVKLLGQCSGCPSAKYTIEEIVETSLKEEIPEVKKVVLIHETSEELIDMARKILKKN